MGGAARSACVGAERGCWNPVRVRRRRGGVPGRVRGDLRRRGGLRVARAWECVAYAVAGIGIHNPNTDKIIDH